MTEEQMGIKSVPYLVILSEHSAHANHSHKMSSLQPQGSLRAGRLHCLQMEKLRYKGRSPLPVVMESAHEAVTTASSTKG